ncbi:MAG: metalloregulator ArsR/SmtB family transcription factor [Rubrivivax sp.]
MPVAPAESRLDATFAALADPTRRAILARLARGDTHVGELAGPFAISGPAVSRHLRVLETAGLIERQVNARWRICRLKPAALQAAHGWLDQYRRYWEESLDRLVELLEPEPPKPPPRRRPATERAVKAPQRKRR